MKTHLGKFKYEKKCKLSDIFISQPKLRLKMVRFDPLNGLFLFDVDKLLLIRLKRDRKNQIRPVKCSFSEGEGKIKMKKLLFSFFFNFLNEFKDMKEVCRFEVIQVSKIICFNYISINVIYKLFEVASY